MRLKDFFTLGSYVGIKRDIIDLEPEREQRVYNLEHKIRDWKISEERIRQIDEELAELRSKVKENYN